ncbi:MAG: glycosyltransferase [Fibrobacter sp.]|nr:glycosyltransferase [Fibrobacter sp.]
MIVKNEEANIATAIESFLPVADEIIVNDTGSTDGTLEILQRYPKVKFIENKWENDFSLARNQSLEHATGTWILFMDADDVIPEDQVESLKQLTQQDLDRVFSFEVINTQAGLAIGAVFSQIRMFPNHPELRFRRKIHEQIVFAVQNLGLKQVRTDVQIWHTGYEDEEMRKQKAQRNLDLLLLEPDRGKDPVISTQLGDSYAILEQHTQAILAYKEVLEIPNSKQLNYDAWQTSILAIGKSFFRLKEYKEAQAWYKQALENDKNSLEATFHLGEAHYFDNEHAIAKPLLYKSLELGVEKSTQAQNYNVIRMYVYEFLCNILYREKEYAAALEIAKKFKEEFPMVIETSFWLGKIFLARRQYAKAIYYLEQGIAKDELLSREAWLALITAYELSGNHIKMQEAKTRMERALAPDNAEDTDILLSVCMIVKNEEKYLSKCLEAITGLWDELIVVDTGSTDNTVSIAQSFGAKVVQFPWVNDFSAARNKSLAEAQGKWIFWLDADDVLLAADKDAIKKLVESAVANEAYSFLIKNSQDIGLTGAVFNQIRLFPNNNQIRFEGRVHEQVMPSLQKLKIPVKFLSIKVIHTGYTDFATIKEKQQRNLKLLEKDIVLDPKNVNAMKYYTMGNAYLDLGEYENAIKWYSKSMERAEKVGEDQHLLKMAPVKIAEVKAQQGNLQEAYDILSQYIQRNSLLPAARLVFAQILKTMDLPTDAAHIYGTLMCFQEEPTLTPVDYVQMKVEACKFLSVYWHERQQVALAVDILKMGLAVGKGEIVHGASLAALYFDLELYEYTEPILATATMIEANAENTLALAKVYIMSNKIEESLGLLEMGAKKYPQNEELVYLYKELKSDLGLK